jgi:hypothetical protein
LISPEHFGDRCPELQGSRILLIVPANVGMPLRRMVRTAYRLVPAMSRACVGHINYLIQTTYALIYGLYRWF